MYVSRQISNKRGTCPCRDVSAASELLLELWDVGGTRGAKQLQKLSQDPTKVIANARFLGSVDVPLSNTLAMSRGEDIMDLILTCKSASAAAWHLTRLLAILVFTAL